MSVITVCKNVIAANNKRGWENPSPPIRIGKKSNSSPSAHAFTVAITDKAGNIVAIVQTTETGEPIVKCGAKVAIMTMYDAKVIR